MNMASAHCFEHAGEMMGSPAPTPTDYAIVPPRQRRSSSARVRRYASETEAERGPALVATTQSGENLVQKHVFARLVAAMGAGSGLGLV